MPHVGLPCDLQLIVSHARHAKIQNLRLARFIHENISGLEIAVNQAALVRVIDGPTDLHHEGQPFAHRQMKRLHVVPQRLAADEFHCEIRLWPQASIGYAGVVDVCNSGMLQARQSLGLVFKPAQQGSVQAWFDHFEGHGAMRLFLDSLVDHAHTAFAQETNDPVSADFGGQRPLRRRYLLRPGRLGVHLLVRQRLCCHFNCGAFQKIPGFFAGQQ